MIAAAVGSAFAATSFANPTGGTVAAGNATFVVNGKTLTVTNTPGTIINWQQFSISQDEITRFIQQNAASAVLNRVTGQDPTQILGKLLSNGRVFLINPNGIVFGNGSVIDVAGFAASTLRMSDADFLSGRQRFEGSGTEGKLTNLGTIKTVEGGHVYLVAPNVENGASGVITSPKGEVVIAAGKTVELVNARTPDIRVEFTAPQGEAVNAGQVVASGGHIGIYGALVRNSGHVSASRAVVGDGGKIIFKAVKDVTLDATSKIEANGAKGGSITVQAETGTLLAQGTIEAKGEEARGGDVKLLGNRVAVNNAVVDASGKTGGGTILIGGDYQGANPAVQNAQRTVVAPSAVIKADATGNGDGGKVIVWADGDTRFYGSITAKGGLEGGDGGFVEVSGKQYLTFSGMVDTRAPMGLTGQLLLDPGDITITNNASIAYPSANVSATDGDWLFADDPGSASISSGTVVAILHNTNVNLQSSGTISIQDDANITYANSPARDFILTANQSVIIGSGVNIRSTGSGVLNIRLIADNDGNQTGFIQVGGGNLTTFATNGGNIALGGSGSAPAIAGGGLGAGVSLLNVAFDAGAGNISLNGAGKSGIFSDGVSIFNSSLSTSGGSITLQGTAVPGDSGYGVKLDSATLHSQGAGNINVLGTGGSPGTGVFASASNITTGGSGSILIQGNSSASPGTSGVRIAGTQISSTSGAAGAGGVSIVGSHSGASEGVGVALSATTISSVVGDISISGTSTSNHGVHWSSGSQTVQSLGAANISISGSTSNASSFGISSDGSTSIAIGGATATGNITLVADTIRLTAADSVKTTAAGVIAIRPADSGRMIEIGVGADESTRLGLGNVGIFSANTVIIGSGSQTGNVTVVGAANFSNLPASGQLQLVTSTGTIRFNDVLTSPANVRVDTSAGDTAAGNIHFNGSGAISAAGKDVILYTRLNAAASAGIVDVLAGNATNVIAGSLSITTGGGIGNTQTLKTEVSTLQALVNWDSGSTAIKNDITNNGSVTVTYLENRGAGDLNFTVTNGSVTFADAQVRSNNTTRVTASGDILFNSPAQTNPAFANPVSNGATANVILSAGGKIDVLQSAGGNTTTTIRATTANLTSGTGIGATNAVRTELGTLTFNNTTSGAVNISEADALTLNGSAFADNVSLETRGASSDLTISGDNLYTGAGTSSATFKSAQNILMSGGANIRSTGGELHVTLNADADANGGGVKIGDGVTTAQILSGGGNVLIGGGANATTSAIGTAATTQTGVLIDKGSITAGAGSVTIRGQGGTSGGGSNNGVHFKTGSAITASGNVGVTGTGGTGGNANDGLIVEGSSIILSGTGAIDLSGTAGGPTNSNVGTFIFSGSNLQTVDGRIRLAGNGGTGTGVDNVGIATGGNVSIRATGTGSIDISGNGSTAATGTSFGAHLVGTSISVNSGNLQVAGIGGGPNADGVRIENGAVLESIGTGNVAVTGTAGATGVGFNSVSPGTNRVGNASMSGNVTLTADSMSLDSNFLATTGGTLIVKPLTGSRGIQLGAGASDATTLGLNSAEIASFNVPNILIGGAAQSGGIVVVGAANFANIGSGGTLALQTTGAANVASNLSTQGNILLTANAGIAFTQTGVTGLTAGAGKAITLSAVGGAVTSANANIDVDSGTAGSVSITANQGIGTLASPINMRTGSFSATNNGTTPSGDLSVSNDYTLTLGAPGQTIDQGAANGNIKIAVTGGNDIIVARGISANGTGIIELNANGNIVFNQSATGNAVAADAAQGEVRLVAGNQIVNQTTFTDVTGATLNFSTANGVSANVSQTALETQVAALTGNNTGAGNVRVTNSGVALNIGSLALGTSNLSIASTENISQSAGIVMASGTTANFGTANNRRILLTHAPGNEFKTVTVSGAEYAEIYNNGSVTLGASNFTNTLILVAGANTANADVTVSNVAVTRTGAIVGGGQLTLEAGRDIIVHGGANISSTGNGVHVTFIADRNQATNPDGGIRFGDGITTANIASQGGNITLIGGPGTGNFAIGTAGTSGVGVWISKGNLDAAAGVVTVRGSSASNHGVLVDGNSTVTAGGGITLSGRNTGGAGASAVRISEAVVTGTGTGGVSISANQTTSANNVYAAHIDKPGSAGATLVQTTGTGDISITGNTTSPGGGVGVFIQNSSLAVATMVQATGGGNIAISGDGNATGTLSAVGVDIRANVSAAGSGHITVQGIGGTGLNSHGVRLSAGDTAATLQTVNGNITVSGSAQTAGVNLDSSGGGIATIESSGAGNIVVQSTSATANVGILFRTISGAPTARITGNTGAVTLIADSIDIGAGNRIATGGTLTLRPLTAGREIQLGTGASDAASLALDATELGQLHANTIVIGSATQTGNIGVVGAANFANVGAGGTLTLQTLGSANVASNLSTAGNVALTAANGIAFTQSGVTGITAGAGKTVTLTAANGAIVSSSAAVDVSTGGAMGAVVLTANQGIGALGASNAMSLDTGNVTATNNGAATVTGDIVIVNATGLNLGGSGLVTNNAGAGNIMVTVTTGDLIVGNTVAAAGGGAVTLAATAGNVAFATTNGVTGVATSGNATLNATAGRVVGNTNGNTSTNDVSATRLTINTANGVGAANALRTASVANLTVNNTVDGNIHIVNGGAALNLDSMQVGSGNLTIVNSTHITQTGPIVMGAGSTATFNATTTGDITLNTSTNDFDTVVIAAGREVRLTDTNALIVGSSALSGNLTVAAGGIISQSGDLVANTAGTTANFQAAGFNVALGNTSNDFNTVVVAGSNVTIGDANALILGNIAATGNLTVTANGAITQAAGASIVNNTAGTVATFNAGGTSDITLGFTTNDFTEIRIASGSVVQVRDGAGGLNIGVSTISGNFDVLAVGNVNVTGNLALNGANSVIYANGALANLTLSNAITHNGAAALLDLRADNNVIFTGAGNVTSIAGALDVTLNSDRDGGGAGAIQFGSGAQVVSNGGNIVLGGGVAPGTTAAVGVTGAPHGVQLAGGNLISGAGNISIRGRGLAGFATPYGVTIHDGSLVQAGTGTISIVGTGVAAGGQSRGVNIEGANTRIATTGGGHVRIAGTGGTSGRGVIVHTDASIDAAGVGRIEVTGTGNGAVGIELASATVGNVSATGDVLLHSLSGTGMTLSSAVLRTAGNLTLHAQGGGTVTQTGGNIGAGGLRVLGDASPVFALQVLNNVSRLAGNLSGTSAKLSFGDLDFLEIGTVTAPEVAGGSATTTTGLTVGAAGNVGNTISLTARDLSQTGAIRTDGLRLTAHVGATSTFNLAMATNDIATLAANASAGVTAIELRYNDANGYSVGTVDGVTGATLLLDSTLVLGTVSGTVSQANAIRVTRLALTGTGNFNLQHAGNDIELLAASANGGNSLYRDQNAFNIGVVDGVTGVRIGANNLTLSTTGTVQHAAAGNNISALGLELLGAGANYQLTDTTNTITSIAGNTGVVNYTNNGSLTVGTVGANSGLTTSGAMTLTVLGAGNDLIFAATATPGAAAAFNAPNNIVFATGAGVTAINAAGQVSTLVAGNQIVGNANTATDINATTANLNAANGIGAANVIELTVANVNVTNSTGGNVVLTDTAGVNIDAVASAGNFSLTSTGSITTSGNLALDGANSVIYANGSTADLTVSNTITHNNAAAGVLDLRADNSVFMIAGGNIAGLGGGALHVTLNSDRDGSGAGAIRLLDAAIASTAGNVSLVGGAGAAGFAAGTGANPIGVQVSNSSITTTGGHLVMRGNGAGASGHGVWVGGGANLQVGAGNATVIGHGVGSSARGVLFGEGDTVATLGSTGGAIVIQGNSGGGATGAEIGVQLGQTGTNPIRITNTGAGTIAITGFGGTAAGGSTRAGVYMAGNVAVIAQNGMIAIEGTGRSAGGTDAHGVNLIGGPASVLSTGSGAIEITGTAAAGSRGISLVSTADSVGGAAATGNILLHAKSGSGMALGGLIQTTGNLTLRAEGGGAVTQPDGNIRVGGLRVLGDTSATFALDQSTNNVAVLAGNVSGATANLSYTDTDGFLIGTVTAPDVAGGTANTTSGLTIGSAASATNTITLIAGGAVTQATGNAVIAGGLRLSGGGNYSLTEATNNISTLAANHTGGLLRYTDAGNFTVGTVNGVAGINVGTNNVTLTTQAGGTISQANAIVAGGLLVSGAGNFDLRHIGNNVSVFAASANGGNSYFHDLDGFNVAVVDGVGGISVGATNNITLSAGNATTLGTVAQGNAIIAGGLELLGNVSYTLTHATNNIATLSANVTGALTYHDADSFTVGNVGGTSGIIAGNDVVLHAQGTTGDLTISQRIQKSTAGTHNIALRASQSVLFATGGSVEANFGGAGGAWNVTVNSDRDAASGGAISMVAGTQILSNGGNIVLGGGTNPATTAAAGTVAHTDGIGFNGATINSANGSISMRGNGAAAGGRGVYLRNNAIDSGSGNISITGQGGPGSAGVFFDFGPAITQSTSGNIVIAGTGGATGNDTWGVVIANGAGLRTQTGTIDVTGTGGAGTGSFGIWFANNVEVGATGSGNVRLTGTGGGAAAAIQADNGGTKNLGNATMTGDVLLRSLGGAIVSDATIVTQGQVTLNSPAGFSQTAGAILGNGNLHVLGAGTFNINSATNNVTVLAANITGNLGYTDAGNFSIGTITSNSGAAGTTTTGIVIVGAGNGVTLTTTGTVTQTHSITAPNLLLLGTGGNYQLNGVATNNVGTLAASTGTVNYTNNAALTVGSVTNIAAATTNGITTTVGGVTLNVGGAATRDLTITQTIASAGNVLLDVSTGNSVIFNQGTLNGVTAGTNTVTINSANQIVVLTTTANDIIATAANLTANTGGIGVANPLKTTVANLTVFSGNGADVRITETDGLNINSANVAGAGTANFTLIGGTAAVTDSGAITVGGTANFHSPGQNVTIDSGFNAGSLTFNGVVVTVNEGSSMTVTGASQATSNLNLTSSGSMNQVAASSITGNAVTILNAGAANNITFNNTTNDFGSVSITSGNVVTIVDTNALVLAASTVSGNYSVTANGAITTSGNLALNGANSTIHAQTANADLTVSNTITYTGAAAVLNLYAGGNVSFTGTGNVTAMAGALDVTLNADRDGASGGAIAMANGARVVSLDGNISLVGGAAGAGAATGMSGITTGISLTGTTLNAGAGAITLRGSGAAGGGAGVSLGTSNLQSTTGTIDITGAGIGAGSAGVQLTGGSTVGASGTGNVRVTGTAGSGADSAILMNGGTNTLGNAAANGEILLRALTTGGISTDATILTSGNVTFNSPAGVTQTGGSVGNATVSVGGLHVLGAGTFNIHSATNNVTVLAANVTGNLGYTDAGNFSIGTITSNSGVAATTTDGITIAGAGNVVTLSTAGVATQTHNITSANMLLLGTGGNYQLTGATNNIGTLAANTGVVNFRNNAALTVGSATSIGGVTTNGITTSGNTALQTLAANTLTVNQPVLAGGAVTFNNGGLLSLNADVTGNAGVSQTGAGTVTITGPRTITTTGNAVQFATAVTLAGGAGNIAIDTTAAGAAAAGGNVTFSGTVAATTANAERLTINAGTGGDVLFNQAVGTAGTPLGNLTVTNARHLNFGGTVDAFKVLQSAGTGNTAVTGNMTAVGAGIELNTDRIVLLGTMNTGAQDLKLNAVNGVTQSGGFITSNQVLLLSSGTGNFTLLQANNNIATQIAANIGGNLSFLNGGNITVGNVSVGANSATGIRTGNGAVSLRSTSGHIVVTEQVNAGTGNVSLTANGNITGAGVITGNQMTANATGGLITLSNAAVSGIDALATAGNITIVNTKATGVTVSGANASGLVDIVTSHGMIVSGTVVAGAGSNVSLASGNSGSGGMNIGASVTGPTGVTLTVRGDDSILNHTAGNITTTNANISLVADEMFLQAGSNTIRAGTANVTVRTYNVGDTIQLGAGSATTTATGNALELSGAELNSIGTSNTLIVGGPSHTGAIQVIGNGTVSNATGNMLINTTGSVNGVSGTLSFTGASGNLRVNVPTGSITGSAGFNAANITLNAQGGISANVSNGAATNNLSLTNTTGAVAIGVPTGDIRLLQFTQGGASASITATDGSIDTGTSAASSGGSFSLVANATGATPRTITVGTGGISAAGQVAISSADDLTINGNVSTTTGHILLAAGSAPGMSHGGAPLTPASEPADTTGSININAPVKTSAGNVSIYSTGSIIQPAGNGTAAGVQGTGDLTVRTFNDGAGAAFIDMRNIHPVWGNSNPAVVLETRRYSDTSAPADPPPVGFASSNIDYQSITGLNLKGIGTGADYVGIAASQDVTISTFSIQARNFTLIAQAGDINVNTSITKDKINQGNPGGSLNLLASGDININANSSVQGVSIGKRIGTKDNGDPLVEYFNHNLRLVATNNIRIEGGIWVTSNLSLRADASVGEVASLAGALTSKAAGNGVGGVIIENTNTLFPLEIRALNLVVGEQSGGAGYGVEFLKLNAGAGIAAAGANLRLDAILRAGIPDTETIATTSSTVTGGRVDIFLSGGLTLTGGNITTSTSGAAAVRSSALAAITGTDVYICPPSPALCTVTPTYNALNTIRLQGGNATASNLAGGGAVGAADALILASNFKRITVAGDIILVGGKATRVSTGQASASALIDPVQELVIRAGGSVVLQAGTVEGGASPASAAARIVNEGLITIHLGGGPGYTFNDPFGGAVALSPGLILIGGAGSGVFDANNRSLPGTAMPITLVGGGIVNYSPGGLTYGPAIVQTGINSFDESLLRYIIFSQLDAAQSDRVRRGLSEDDLGGTACQ